MGMLWLIFQITGPDINIRGWGEGHKISFMSDWDVLPIKTNLWHLMSWCQLCQLTTFGETRFNDWRLCSAPPQHDSLPNFMGYELWCWIMNRFCFPLAPNRTISNFLQTGHNGAHALKGIHKYLTFLRSITKTRPIADTLAEEKIQNTVLYNDLWCPKVKPNVLKELLKF